MRRMITKYPPVSWESSSASIDAAQEAAALVFRGGGSSEIYAYLRIIYSIYREWRHQKNPGQSARRLAKAGHIPLRKGMSPIRILIDATLLGADLKQKSRWVRALEYVYSESVSPSQFRRFIGRSGGVAGCARLAAGTNRKRRHAGGDWND